MNTRNDCEYRLDIRGKGRKVHRVKILERQGGGKFHPCNGDFTDDHVAHFGLFAKAAAAVAKAAAPPFDAAAIVSKVNGSRRKKRSGEKLPSGPGLFDKFGDSNWE